VDDRKADPGAAVNAVSQEKQPKSPQPPRKQEKRDLDRDGGWKPHVPPNLKLHFGVHQPGRCDRKRKGGAPFCSAQQQPRFIQQNSAASLIG
jgi:hypothetical protein